MKQNHTDYYVYELRLKSNDLVFYVGKGRRNRVEDHRAKARNRNCKQYAVYQLYPYIRNMIWALGDDYYKAKIHENLDDETACQLEKDRVAELGIDNLINGVISTWNDLDGRKVRIRLSKYRSGKLNEQEAELVGKVRGEIVPPGSTILSEAESKMIRRHRGRERYANDVSGRRTKELARHKRRIDAQREYLWERLVEHYGLPEETPIPKTIRAHSHLVHGEYGSYREECSRINHRIRTAKKRGYFERAQDLTEKLDELKERYSCQSVIDTIKATHDYQIIGR